MSDVAIVRCESYEKEEVFQAVKRGLDLIGGAQQFVQSGEKILLKPNLLVAEVPEKCVTTHPSVFRAVATVFKELDITLSYGDSPAFGSTSRAAKKAGLFQVAEELGLELADFKNGKEIFFEDGVQNRKFVVAKGVLEADGLISLPKLKTHALERFTGSVKNQFGCVPGMLKGEFHVKLPSALDFGQMLVDLNNYIKPRLYIMDGIQAMEGNGPRGGKPKQMNVLLFSSDPIALDATVCRLIDLKPEIVPTIRFGHASGSGEFEEEKINLLGDDIEGLKNKSFDVKKSPIEAFKVDQSFWAQFTNNRLVPKPVILKEKCTQCGTCISMCPTKPKSVDWKNDDKEKPPVHNYDLCIRCFCCQEVCPDESIVLKQPLIRRVGGFITGSFKK